MTEIEPVEKVIAKELIETPGVKVEILPTGGVKVGDNRTFWRRAWDSWVIRIQVFGGILATIWLAIPQDTMLSLIPAKYAAIALLLYQVITTLARMRNL